MEKKYKDLKEFFSILLKNKKLDDRLWKELYHFRRAFMVKNQDHIEFFGDKLVGVYKVRFSSLDDIELVENIYNLDLNYCVEEIKKVKGIDPDRKVSSNFIYHLLLYTMHVWITDPKINKNKEKLRKYLLEPLLIMEYRMFCSIHTHMFRFPFGKEIAITALQKLSNKYLIKQLDNWEQFFEKRIDDFIEKNGIYYKRLIRYSTEDAINIIITLQTKIRSVLKNLARIMYGLLEETNHIKSDSMFYEDGNMKEVSTGVKPMIEKIKTTYINKTDFIDEPLVSFIERMFNSLPEGLLLKTLNELVNDEEEELIKAKDMLEILEKSIILNYEYLNRLGINPLDKTKIYLIITNIKNYWSSSKVKNKDMDNIKKTLFKTFVKATGRKTKWMIVADVIAFIVYVYSLALKKT